MGRISDALKRMMKQKDKKNPLKIEDSIQQVCSAESQTLTNVGNLSFPKVLFGDVDPNIFSYYGIADFLIEEYKHLIASISNTSAKLWLVTSSVSGEGKTVFSLNLSIIMARSLEDKSVLYVDADMRAPNSALRYLDLPETKLKGFSDILQGGANIEDAIVATEVKNLYIMPRGSSLDPALLSSKNLAPILDNLRSNFDLVFIDSSPIKNFVDSRLVAPCVDAVIIVVRMNKTPRGTIRYAVQILDDAGVKRKYFVLNGIMNYLPRATADRYYRY